MPDFNDANKLGSGKEMVDRLTNLIAIFENKALDFSKNRADGDDILGDAYEYLMRHFATESGKSKGQFYTPAEVSRIMAQVIGIQGQDQRRHHRLRPHLRLGLAAAQGRPTEAKRGHPLRAGKGRRHQRSGPDEHDPAQQPDGDIGRAIRWRIPKFTEQGQLKTLRLRGRQSALLDKRWSTGLDPLAR
jgi:type I restriction enzyme M protein